MYVPERDAEELVQDVLMKVHAKVSAFRRVSDAKFTTWIFQIAQNCAIDFLRTKRVGLDQLPENFEPVRWHGHFAGRNSDLLAWQVEELTKLSAENQQILLWRAQDFSFARIGGWLGLKETTAKVRYFRARKKLEAAGNQSGLFAVPTVQNIPELEAEHD
jgi:RNA polymerase sigma-70 factor (ECF subfamily)